MNLLPKSRQEFGETQYWDKFFTQRGKKSFDWYGEYAELCGQLHKYVKPKDDILMLGCGNSKLSADLYDVGHKHITNIDISKIVIKQMQDSNRESRPDMVFTQMDATAMSYPDASFSVAIDKGTLDALMPDTEPETLATVDKYWAEIKRVLRQNGRYICVSLLQRHILTRVLDHFPANNFLLRVIRCPEAEERTRQDNPEGFAMPVFIIVATKFMAMPQPILEVQLVEQYIQRVTSKVDMFDEIDSCQKSALVCSNLKRPNAAVEDELQIELMHPTISIASPRYTIIVIDNKVPQSGGKFAAFVVPQGRECDWMFGTKEGRQKLIDSVPFQRVAIVLLNREHSYSSMDEVQADLSEHIKQLAPKNLGKERIPFLSVGHDIGQREVIFRGNSTFSGDYVIEEMTKDNGPTFRRLIFMNNPFVVQSEAMLKETKSRTAKSKSKRAVDRGFVACQHHLYMTCGTVAAVLNKAENSHVAVIGLGGGALCTFIQSVVDTTITAVDIDAAMLKVATEYFGLTVSDRLKVVIADGLDFIRQSDGPKFDAILLDVDSKDRALGLSCPPKQFLEPATLRAIKDRLTSTGVFVVNLVCRDDRLRKEIMDTLKAFFAVRMMYKMPDEVNEIIFCVDNVEMDLKELLRSATVSINDSIKKKKLNGGEKINVDKLTAKLSDMKC